MTYNEAAEMLKSYEPKEYFSDEMLAAYKMAISVLEEKGKPKESKALKLCTCGCKQKPQMWYTMGTHMKFYKCGDCGRRSAEAKTEIQARRNWNTEIEEAKNAG